MTHDAGSARERRGGSEGARRIELEIGANDFHAMHRQPLGGPTKRQGVDAAIASEPLGVGR